MGVFSPIKKILPASQKALWSELGPLKGLGFVLYGGTAVALRLGHRFSVDFDFFSKLPLDETILRRAVPFLARSQTLDQKKDTLTVLVPTVSNPNDTVKVSLFGGIGMGRVGEPDMTDDGVLSVASLEDLLALKLVVILNRAESKDYQDIAAILRAGLSLGLGLATARGMYGLAFQPAAALRALTYFGDGDLASLSRADKEQLIRAAGQIRDLPPAPPLRESLNQ